MRTASVSALAFLLSLICLPSPAAAQTNVATPDRLSLAPELSPSAPGSKLLNNQSAAAVVDGTLAGNQASIVPLLKDRASKENPFSNGQWKNGRPGTNLLEPMPYFSTPRRVPPAEKACAHILIWQFQSADSKMVLERPGGTSDNMSVAAGLPACNEDVR